VDAEHSVAYLLDKYKPEGTITVCVVRQSSTDDMSDDETITGDDEFLLAPETLRIDDRINANADSIEQNAQTIQETKKELHAYQDRISDADKTFQEDLDKRLKQLRTDLAPLYKSGPFDVLTRDFASSTDVREAVEKEFNVKIAEYKHTLDKLEESKEKIDTIISEERGKIKASDESIETLKKEVAALTTATDHTTEFKKLFGGEDNTEFGEKINVLMNAADEDLKELPGDSWVERTYNAAKSKLDNVGETVKEKAKSAITTLSGGYLKFDTATDHTTQPFLALIEKMLNTMIADHKEVEKLKKAQWSWSDYLKYGGGALLAGGAAGLAGRELGSLAYNGLKSAVNYKTGGLLLGTPQPNQTGQDPEIASMQRQLREIEKRNLSQQIQNAQRVGVAPPPSVPITTAVATVPLPSFDTPSTTVVEPQPTISLSEPAPNPGIKLTTELATLSDYDNF